MTLRGWNIFASYMYFGTPSLDKAKVLQLQPADLFQLERLRIVQLDKFDPAMFIFILFGTFHQLTPQN